MATLTWIVLFLIYLGVFCYHRASLWVWSLGVGAFLLVMSFAGPLGSFWLGFFWLVYAVTVVPLNILPLRRWLISDKALKAFRQVMPQMSDTEKQALEAGTVGWNRDLFSGIPDWNKLCNIAQPTLSLEEQDFIDNQVEQVCKMINSWRISREMDVPQEIWDHFKREGYFGLIIPKSYGGKEFSAFAHSEIIVKIAGLSSAVATIMSVPNSLGPAELLLRYGTDKQKQHYLPRLATGEDIPCFALTSPVAGSDASSISDHGVVCKREFEGRETVGVLLNWNKRYITLAPVATLIGLAFKLYDPDHLLGQQEYIGITCALIPAKTKGITAGRRHYPLDAAFPNGPTQGVDVFIPMDWVIGGQAMVGHGWRMLMECLAAGRSISLPSMATGAAKRAMLGTGSYARIRRQFSTYIANFGGVEEVVSRVVANTYIVESLRVFTVGALDLGEKPAVASAICKYYTTELSRRVITDAMDVHGGKGICMGPHNYLAQSYIEAPISITVEGANILTRSMIIFGQGAIRCHPYVLIEMKAAELDDHTQAVKQFDKALFGHLGGIISNAVRAFVLAITSSSVARAPTSRMHRYYQHFSRYSAAFGLVADIAMLTLGGKLKRLEKLSGRLGDVLSLLYMGSTVLRFYEEQTKEAKNNGEFVIVEYICRDFVYQLQNTLNDLFANMPNKFISVLLHIIVFPFGKWAMPPSDDLGEQVANTVLQPSSVRERFAKNLYMEKTDRNVVGAMNEILEDLIAVEPILKKLNKAKKNGLADGKTLEESVQLAVDANVLVETEAEQILKAEAARMGIINVDDFAPDFKPNSEI